MQIPSPYQEQGANFLFSIKKGLLADEPGVGKTLQAIMAALRIQAPTLVICPATLRIDPWARTITEQDPNAAVIVIEAGGNVYDYATGDGSQWLIINYDLLDRYEAAGLRALIDYKTMIVDEAHAVKEMTTTRTEQVTEIAESAENIFLLTGTPILNRPIELFTLLKILRHPMGDNWYAYAYRYCGAKKRKIKQWVQDRATGEWEYEEKIFFDVSGATNLEELRRRLKPIYLRRRKKDVLPDLLPKLPPKVITVEMEEPYATKYAKAWDNYMDYLDRIKAELVLELGSEGAYSTKVKNIEKSRHLVEMQKLQQITSIAKLKQVAKDAINMARAGEKVIIFTVYTETLNVLARVIKKNDIACVTLNGETKPAAKDRAKDSFQNDAKIKIFVGNIRAAGVGITLTASCKVLFIDEEWTPALNEQAVDRAHRRGQLRQVETRIYTAKDTIDEHKQKKLAEKQAVISSIMDGAKIEKIKNESILKEVLKMTLADGKLFHS